MNWKKADNALVAETDFGRYTVTRREGSTREFDISLDSGDETRSLEGVHSSILEATDAAQKDLEHREKMWGSL